MERDYVVDSVLDILLESENFQCEKTSSSSLLSEYDALNALYSLQNFLFAVNRRFLLCNPSRIDITSFLQDPSMSLNAPSNLLQLLPVMNESVLQLCQWLHFQDSNEISHDITVLELETFLSDMVEPLDTTPSSVEWPSL
ncbi:hypothetical protein GEMRC1_012210 [Eukaryota sp. GEM-RC1]